MALDWPTRPTWEPCVLLCAYYKEDSPEDGYCNNKYGDTGGNTVCRTGCTNGRLEVYSNCAASCSEGDVYSGSGVGWQGSGGGGMVQNVGLVHIYCTPYENYDYYLNNNVCGDGDNSYVPNN